MSPLERVRALCLALPEVTERLSHGSPAWFVRTKPQFVAYWDNHHDDGRLVLWCAAPPGAQQAYASSEPERYFVPPYVGHRGWLGVELEGSPDWTEIAAVIEAAYRTVAPKTLVKLLDHAG